MKKAVILAAGKGQRLGELTKDIPKCLLPVDSQNNMTLLDFSLQALNENNINQVFIVSGFAEEKLKNHVNKKWLNILSIKFIFNPKYAEYNNIYSAYLAKEIWDDETILLNSDIVYHPLILSNLVSRIDREPISYLVIDDTKKLIAEDMKVQVDKKNRITKINKNLDLNTSIGEYIGITCLKDAERVKFLRSLERNIKDRNFDLYYEDALAHILDEISVYPCSTSGKVWTEVDTKEDYEVAKKISTEITRIII